MRAGGTRTRSGHHTGPRRPQSRTGWYTGGRRVTESVKYKKPARINIVSVTIVLAIAIVVLLGWKYIPVYVAKQEAYRVLEEYGSQFMSRKSLYLEDANARDQLERKMTNDLRTAGVTDPAAEVWIEVDGHEVVLGVAYVETIEWPFGVLPRQEKVYELEHRFVAK